MNARDHYDSGRLHEAVDAAAADVKSDPTHSGKRSFLCELLCFAGELAQADEQLDAWSQEDPQVAIGVSLFRQLIRAEQHRQQFYAEGRLPDFLDQEMTADMGRHLQAAVLVREGKLTEAAEVLNQAEAERPKSSGSAFGQPFDDLRDLDDLTASFFEVLTSTGKYYWIPLERVESIEFRTPARPRDLLWRAANMSVRGGPDGEVFLPVLYAGSHADSDDHIRLGRETRWRDDDDAGAPVRGLGQRMFLIGGEGHSILELQTLSINPPSPA